MAEGRPETKSAPEIRIAPPANVGWLVEVLGVQGTFKLIEMYGGTHLHVPNGSLSEGGADRRFIERLGETLARDLMRHFGGGVIALPLCLQWLTEVYAMQGMPLVEIALKLRCTDATVWRRLNYHKRPAVRGYGSMARSTVPGDEQ